MKLLNLPPASLCLGCLVWIWDPAEPRYLLKGWPDRRVATFHSLYCPRLPTCQKVNVNMLVNKISSWMNWWSGHPGSSLYQNQWIEDWMDFLFVYPWILQWIRHSDVIWQHNFELRWDHGQIGGGGHRQPACLAWPLLLTKLITLTAQPKQGKTICAWLAAYDPPYLSVAGILI